MSTPKLASIRAISYPIGGKTAILTIGKPIYRLEDSRPVTVTEITKINDTKYNIMFEDGGFVVVVSPTILVEYR